MSNEESGKRDPGRGDPGFSRRSFLKSAGLTIAAVGVAGPGAASPLQAGAAKEVRMVGPGKVEMTFLINGQTRKLAVEPWQTLLDTVRDQLHLTGSKRVCDRGSCGACTMIVGGKTVKSCSMLAIDAAEKKITTIEGIAKGDELSPLQEAFIECDALQCGFCTPGVLMACTALLASNAKPSRQQIAEGIAGNICRCGTYQNIFEAVELAARKGGTRAEF